MILKDTLCGSEALSHPWEPVKKTNSLAQLQTYRTETWGVQAQTSKC